MRSLTDRIGAQVDELFVTLGAPGLGGATSFIYENVLQSLQQLTLTNRSLFNCRGKVVFEGYGFFWNNLNLLPSEQKLELECLRRLAVVLRERVSNSRVNELVVTVLGNDVHDFTISVKPCYTLPLAALPLGVLTHPSTLKERQRTLENFSRSLTDGGSQARVEITLKIRSFGKTASVCEQMSVGDWSEAELERMLILSKEKIADL